MSRPRAGGGAARGGGHAGPHRVLGDLRHAAQVGCDLADADGDRRVAVPAVEHRAAVDARSGRRRASTCRRAGDGVHDLLVDRGADRRRVAVVALERRDGAGGRGSRYSAIASRSAVETPGRDRLAHARQGGGDDQAGAAHLVDLLGGLELDQLVAPCFEANRNRGPLRADGASAAVRAQGVDRADRDVLDRSGGVDAHQLALRAVVVDERRRFAGVDLQALGDRLGLVVVALEELAAAAVADALAGRARRTRRARSCRSRGRSGGRRAAGSPLRSSTTSSRTRSSAVPRSASSLSSALACGTVRGKPSSRKPSVASASASRSRTMLMVTSSGTSWPASMYRLASTPSGVPCGDVGAENVSGRDLRHGQVCGDELGLSPLTRPGGTYQHEAHYRRNPS